MGKGPEALPTATGLNGWLHPKHLSIIIITSKIIREHLFITDRATLYHHLSHKITKYLYFMWQGNNLCGALLMVIVFTVHKMSYKIKNTNLGSSKNNIVSVSGLMPSR